MITKEIVNRLSYEVKDLFDFYDLKKLRKSDKQKSEDISGLLETVMEEMIEGAIAPKVDSEPDIRLNGEPVEIKTTSGTSWRGGEYSKRDGYFLFVSWRLNPINIPSFFIAGLNLTKQDWTISGSDNYYATTYNKKNLLENYDKVNFYSGSLKRYNRGVKQCIAVEYETCISI